jgi:hypothetical protein
MYGFCLANMMVNGQTMVQTEVPPHLIGRTTGVWSMWASIGATMALPLGAIGEAVGLRYALSGTGLLLLTCALANGLLRTSVLRSRQQRPAEAGLDALSPVP